MKLRVDFGAFYDAFARRGTLNHFSGAGLEALFTYLEGFERNTGVELDLDVISLCVHYSEIECIDPRYSKYVGGKAHLGEMVIAKLPNSVLVVD